MCHLSVSVLFIKMNKELLEGFTKFCNEHPELRFWQALYAWTKFESIRIKKDKNDLVDSDPFYWTNKDK